MILFFILISVVSNSNTRETKIVLFFVYSGLILLLTIGTRAIGIQEAKTDLFWSYKEWLFGNWDVGWQILANIALFIPLGMLLDKKHCLFIPILLSVSIELTQLLTLRGLFEFDDILNN